MSDIKVKTYSPDLAADSYIKTIKRITRKNYRWPAMAVTLFFSVLVSPGYFPLVMILQLGTLISYYNKHFEADRFKKEASLIPSLRALSIPLSTVIKKLAIKLIPFEIIYFLYHLAVCFIDLDGGVDGFLDHVHPFKYAGIKELSAVHPMHIASLIAWPVFAVLIPILYHKYARYIMNNENTGRIVWPVRILVFVLVDLVGYFSAIVVGIMGIMMAASIAVHILINVEENEAVVYAFSTSANKPLAISLVCLIIWLALMLRSEIEKHMIKKLNARIALFTIGIVFAVIMVITSARNYVMSSESGFVNMVSGKETSYTMEDVTDFVIYCDDNTLAMKVSMKDGKSLEVLTDMTEENERWAKEYDYNFYDYVRTITVKLQNLGIPGRLEDTEKLAKKAKAENGEMERSFEQIKALF